MCCASSAFAMLPSIASARSSSSFLMRGSTSFQKKNRMMTKQISDPMMSYHAGMSGLLLPPLRP